jgi:flagellar basal-body rod modification protein FlgD
MFITTHAASNHTSATGSGAAGSGTKAAAGTSSTSSSTSAAASAANGVTLGGTDFLTLMLAQLKNQDPTSPVDSNTFLSQLAELSEVQGITALNTSFTGLSSSLTSSQALQASSLLGHTALVSSSTATLATAGATVTGAVNVPQTSASVMVDVMNSSGELVQQVNLGAQSAGLANFTWNGEQGDGSKAPAGTYSITAQVAGVASGTAIPTYVNGTVESVTMGAGSAGLTLNVSGQGSVLFSNVEQISP